MRQEHSAENDVAMTIGTSRAALLCLLFAAVGCTSTDPGQLRRFEYSQAQMGLDFRMTLYAPDETTARAAAAAAYARIAELNQVLSDYDPDSELSRLSQSSGTGEWRTVSPDLWRVLEAGQLLAQQSGGAFDLTVGPSVNLWRRARRQHALPSPELLSEMRARVGYTNLLLEARQRRAQLTRADMRLDAGGIAKGYALDEALVVLRRYGIRRAMIHAGGDMIFGQPPPGRAGWLVELPGTGLTNPPVLSLAHQALATSGDLSQFIEINGVRFSHIVDPRTGIGLTNRTLVNVIAPHGLTADALATAFSVLGPAGLPALLPLYPDVHCQLTEGLGAEARVVSSPGFARHVGNP